MIIFIIIQSYKVNSRVSQPLIIMQTFSIFSPIDHSSAAQGEMYTDRRKHIFYVYESDRLREREKHEPGFCGSVYTNVCIHGCWLALIFSIDYFNNQ